MGHWVKLNTRQGFIIALEAAIAQYKGTPGIPSHPREAEGLLIQERCFKELLSEVCAAIRAQGDLNRPILSDPGDEYFERLMNQAHDVSQVAVEAEILDFFDATWAAGDKEGVRSSVLVSLRELKGNFGEEVANCLDAFSEVD